MSGSNADADLRRRAERRMEQLDAIAEAQAQLKEFKAEDKADGFSERAMAQSIRELRRGADYQADQLSLELELDTYRRVLGLPRTLEAAQEAVREAADTVPGAAADDGREAADDRLDRTVERFRAAGYEARVTESGLIVKEKAR